MMEKEKLENICNHLKNERREYTLASSQEKTTIENRVRGYSDSFGDELYIELSGNTAGTLFKHGFFESDMDNSISILESMINKKS